MAYATFISNYVVLTTVQVYSELTKVSNSHLSSSDAIKVDTAFGVVVNTLPLAGASVYIKPQSPNLNSRGSIMVGSSDSYFVESGSSVFVLNFHEDAAPVQQELRVIPEGLKAEGVYWGSSS